jgi:O-antigen ligase
MKKSVSLSRICLVVCIIILLATAIVTSTLGSLLPVFGFVALLDLIPLVRGNRTQKIVAFVILAIAVTLFIFAIEGFKLQRQRFERMRKTHVPQQISPGAKSALGFYHISAWRFAR